jgi:hypothetical protein
MIHACAEATGLPSPTIEDGVVWLARMDSRGFSGINVRAGGIRYNPLTNKAQAFELVEKLHLACHPPWSDKQAKWRVNDGTDCIGSNTNLCRAIVECVAAMKGKK